jgi:hypothetical protein
MFQFMYDGRQDENNEIIIERDYNLTYPPIYPIDVEDILDEEEIVSYCVITAFLCIVGL